MTVLCVNHADAEGKDITHQKRRKTISASERDGDVRIERVGRWFGVSRLEVCPELPKRIKEETAKADIIHLHTPNPLMLVGWWLSGNRNVPLVVTHHSDIVKQRVLRFAVAPFESRVYQSAKLILTTSPKYLEGSTQLRPYQEKTKALPLAIGLEPFLKPAEKILCRAKEFRLAAGGCPIWLMVGRLTYYKGYHVAIEALANVAGRLVIIGNGPLESELKAQAAKVGVSERIEWNPQVGQDELVAWYHAATALWFPSIAKSEGFGLVQVEAMAAGCPVINTEIDGSGVSWVSQHEVSGLTVRVGDAKALAQAARRLMEDGNLRNRLIAGAKSRATSEFASTKMGQDSLEIYLAICDGEKSGGQVSVPVSNRSDLKLQKINSEGKVTGINTGASGLLGEEDLGQ